MPFVYIQYPEVDHTQAGIGSQPVYSTEVNLPSLMQGLSGLLRLMIKYWTAFIRL
ncbi:MAG: hypothetical protein V7K57_08955 [Nostoc sp.]